MSASPSQSSARPFPASPALSNSPQPTTAPAVVVPAIRISPHSRTASSSSSRSAASFSAAHTPISLTPASHHQHHKAHAHARRSSLADAVLDARRGAGARLKRAANKIKRWGTRSGGSGSSGSRRRGRRSSMSSGTSSTTGTNAPPGMPGMQRSARDQGDVPMGVEEDWIEDEDEDEDQEYSDLSPFDDEDDDGQGLDDETNDSDGWSASVHSSRHGSADMDLPWTPRALRGPPPGVVRRQPPAKPTRSATAPPLGSLPIRHIEGAGSLPSLSSPLPMHPLSQVRNSAKSPAAPRFTASPPLHSPPLNDAGRLDKVQVEDEDHRSPTENTTTGFPLALASLTAAKPATSSTDAVSLPHYTRPTHLTAFSHANPADIWLAASHTPHGHRCLARRWLFARTSLVTGATLGYAVLDVSTLGIDLAQVPHTHEHVARTAFEGLIVEDDDDDDDGAAGAPVIVSDVDEGSAAVSPQYLLTGFASGPAVELQFAWVGDLNEVAVLDIGRLAGATRGKPSGCQLAVSDLAVQLVVETDAAVPTIVLVAPHLRAKDLFVQYVGFVKLERERPLMAGDGTIDDNDGNDVEFLAEAYHALNDLVAAEHEVAHRYQQAQETLAEHQSTLTTLTTHLSDLHLAASGLVTDAQGECRALPGSLSADLDAHATAVDTHQAHFAARVRNRAKVLAAYQVQALAALDLAEHARGKGTRGRGGAMGDKGPWIARVAVGLVVVVAVVRGVNPWGVFSRSDSMSRSTAAGTSGLNVGEASRPVPPGAWKQAPAPPGHTGPPGSHPSQSSAGGVQKVVTIVREIYYSAAPVTVQAVAVATPIAGGSVASDNEATHAQNRKAGRWWWDMIW